MEITTVTPEEIKIIKHDGVPIGRFIALDGDKWIAVENQISGKYAKDFDTETSALEWLELPF